MITIADLILLTNVDLYKKGIKKTSTYNECITCFINILENKHIKSIHPNIFNILLHERRIRVNNGNFINSATSQYLDICYQLKIEYFIIENLKHILQKKNKNLFKYFFEKYLNNAGAKHKNNLETYITKNINIETRHESKLDIDKQYRTDMQIMFENGYKIIIEINEILHENTKDSDIARGRTILDNDPKIKKLYFIREHIFGIDKKRIKRFVKKELVQYVIKLGSIHNEKKYVVNELMKSSGDDKQYRKICKLIYDSHLRPTEPIVNINILNRLHNVNFNDKYIESINAWCLTVDMKYNTNKEDEYIESDDDVLSDILSDSDEEEKEPIVSDFYINNNNSLLLTWKGFNAYYRFIHNHISPKNDIKIFNFFTDMITNYINILKKSRDDIMDLNDNPRIWGYDNNDYIGIIKN